MLGYGTEGELLGRSAMEFIAEPDRPLAAENMMKTLTQGTIRGVVYPLLRKDGTVIWGEMSCAVVRDSDAKPRYFMAVTRDIGDRKRTEAALRESELRFRDLSDLLPQPVFEAEISGRISFANRSAFRTFGFNEEDLARGVSIAEVVVAVDKDRAMEMLQRAFAGTGTHGDEIVARRKDGTTFSVVVYSTPVRRNEQITGIRGIVIDISERKAQEAALRASEERYRALVENASDAIILSDLETGIIAWSTQEEFARAAREPLIGW